MPYKVSVSLLLALALLAGCTMSMIDPNPPTPLAAQAFVERELLAFWQERYIAYRTGQERTIRFLQSTEVAPTPALPPAVTHTYQLIR